MAPFKWEHSYAALFLKSINSIGLLHVIQQSSSLILMVGYLIFRHLSLLLLSVYVKNKKPSQILDGLRRLALAVILAAVAAAVLIAVLAVILAVVLIIILIVVSAVSWFFHIVIIISCHGIDTSWKIIFCYRSIMACSAQIIRIRRYFETFF